MDSVQTLAAVAAETKRVVAGVAPDRLAAASPCAGWTVRDVVNHITAGATMFAVAAEEGAIADEQLAALMTDDQLGDDPVGAFTRAADRALAAFGIPGVMDKVVTLPFGTMPAGVALDIAIFDLTVHALDIAAGSGQGTDLDAGVLEAALTRGQAMIGPEMRAPGLFAAEVDLSADAPLGDRLLAFAGRSV